MRKPKEKQNVDLTRPVDLDQLKSDDPCFGKLWDPRDSSCAICHAIETCGILYQEAIKKKKKTFELEKGPLLDEERFSKVDFDKIAKAIERQMEKGIQFTLEDLKFTVATYAVSKDTTATMEYIKRMLPKYNMTIQNGIITMYGKGTDNHQEPGRLTK